MLQLVDESVQPIKLGGDFCEREIEHGIYKEGQRLLRFPPGLDMFPVLAESFALLAQGCERLILRDCREVS